MKTIITFLVLLAFSAVCFASGVEMHFQTTGMFLNTKVHPYLWTGDTLHKWDTLALNGTAVYFPAFNTNANGYVTFHAKAVFSSAAADTDTVRFYIYRAGWLTSNVLEMNLVDSLNVGGRGDTLLKFWTPTLSSKFDGTWIVGVKKIMGKPKLFKLNVNIQ